MFKFWPSKKEPFAWVDFRGSKYRLRKGETLHFIEDHPVTLENGESVGSLPDCNNTPPMPNVKPIAFGAENHDRGPLDDFMESRFRFMRELWRIEQLAKPNNKGNEIMTDEKMTKAEAEIACDKELLEVLHGGKGCTSVRISDGAFVFFELDCNTGEPDEKHKFVFSEPVPVPAKYKAVADGENNDLIYYSRGTLSRHGNLNVSEDSDCLDNDRELGTWEPVEIVRNGEHKKALELLGHCRDKINGCSSVLTADTISAFLADSEKAGGV